MRTASRKRDGRFFIFNSFGFRDLRGFAEMSPRYEKGEYSGLFCPGYLMEVEPGTPVALRWDMTYHLERFVTSAGIQQFS
jgi:hypothetical protein